MEGIKKLLFITACVFLGITFISKLPAINIGNPAAEVYAEKWLNADSFSLKDNKDKVVVLEFWATWCGPCRTSIPHLKALSDKYKDKVVFVSLTNEPVSKDIESFCKQNNMTWVIGLGSNSGMDYKVRSIPRAFIVKDDKIIWSGHPMNPEFEKKLEPLAYR